MATVQKTNNMVNKKRVPFQLRSGNSPLKIGGAVVRGLKYGYRKLVPIGATTETAYNVKTKSKPEKILRDIDSWVTGGVGAALYDLPGSIRKYNKNIEKRRKNYKARHLDKIHSKSTHKTSKLKLPPNTFPKANLD